MSAADEMFEEFRVEMAEIAQEIDEAMLRWESDPLEPELLNRIFRQLHTLKGSAGFLELCDLADLCHAAEDLFAGYRAAPRAPTKPELAALNEAINTIQARLSPSRDQHTASLKSLAERLRTLARTPPAAQADRPEGRGRSRGFRTNPNLRIFRESAQKAASRRPAYAAGKDPGAGEPRPLPKVTRRPVAERPTPPPPEPPSSPPLEEGGLLGSRLLGSAARFDFSASSFGPWSPERLEALHQGRRPSELREAVKREVEAEAATVDPLDLLLRDELAAARLVAALSDSRGGLESEVLFPDLESGVTAVPDRGAAAPASPGRSPAEGSSSRSTGPAPGMLFDDRGGVQVVPSGAAARLVEEVTSGGDPFRPRAIPGTRDLAAELRRAAPLADVDLAVPPSLQRMVPPVRTGAAPATVDPDQQATVCDVPIPALPETPGEGGRAVQAPGGEPGGAVAASSPGPSEPMAVPDEGGLFIERAMTVRVDVAKLDSLLNLLGDLLQEKHRHAALVETLMSERTEDPTVSLLATSHRRLERLLGDLQDTVLSTRMLPVQGVFRRYPRIVKDLATRLGKEVELELLGEETELDRALLEGLFDPLIHLLRNSLDHGIEPLADRIRRGKARRGTITLSAAHEGNQVVLEIRDDGRGIDPAETAARAVALQLLDPDRAKEMNDQEKVDLIFVPGFTSRTQVTETSGRGVGMSVVRDHLRRIGGLITVTSRPGEGTTLRIVMPLTLAILQVLLVRVGTTRYALPLSSVVGVMRVEREQLTLYRGGWFLPRPGSMLPLFSLAALLGLEVPHLPPERCYLAEVGVAEKRYGVWVDGFAGIFESVIKSLEGSLTRLPGVAGGTFIGGGELVLVLDVGTLLEGQSVTSRQ